VSCSHIYRPRFSKNQDIISIPNHELGLMRYVLMFHMTGYVLRGVYESAVTYSLVYMGRMKRGYEVHRLKFPSCLIYL
jgi:hypothetical protein